MLKNWWKALTILLLASTLAIGLLVPLGPGILYADKVSMQAGDSVTLQLTTYNTRFTAEKQPLKARLRLDSSKAIEVSQLKVIDDTHLAMSFALPAVQYSWVQKPYPVLQVYGEETGRINFKEALGIRPAADSNIILGTYEFAAAEDYPRKKTFAFPFLNLLEESIRNLFFHVPMWFGMMIIMCVSVVYSIRHLNQQNKSRLSNDLWRIERDDVRAKAFAGIGILMGILGVTTGALWAKHTWGQYWSWDVKQNTSAVALLIYLAYFVLRSSIEDHDKRARTAAVYNIFAFATLIPLLYIIPKQQTSLHPGMDGNPAFKSYDLDSTMRMVFYPAILGWTLLGVWLATLQIRIERISLRRSEQTP